jgi:hypothetical protein
MAATKAKGAPVGNAFRISRGSSVSGKFRQRSLRIVHVELDRVRGHLETLDFGHLELDEVVVEHAAVLQEGAVLVEIFHQFTSDDVVTGPCDGRAQRPAAAPLWIRLLQYSRPSAPERMPAA